MNEVKASCHCGAVALVVQQAPHEVTKCNCSLCSKYGALWAYLSSAEVTINPTKAPTEVYAWNGKHVDFHRCANCGCITHWVPRDSRDRRGINARLFDPQVLMSAKITRRDGAGTGVFTE